MFYYLPRAFYFGPWGENRRVETESGKLKRRKEQRRESRMESKHFVEICISDLKSVKFCNRGKEIDCELKGETYEILNANFEDPSN